MAKNKKTILRTLVEESFKELKEQEIKGTAKIETVDISENERAISDFNKDLTAQETKRVGRKKSTPPQVEQTAEEAKSITEEMRQQ